MYGSNQIIHAIPYNALAIEAFKRIWLEPDEADEIEYAIIHQALTLIETMDFKRDTPGLEGYDAE